MDNIEGNVYPEIIIRDLSGDDPQRSTARRLPCGSDSLALSLGE
ncbi:MAG: hypothetical protein AABY51_09750 [Deltaproteobacteria bacterium]